MPKPSNHKDITEQVKASLLVLGQDKTRQATEKLAGREDETRLAATLR